MFRDYIKYVYSAIWNAFCKREEQEKWDEMGRKSYEYSSMAGVAEKMQYLIDDIQVFSWLYTFNENMGVLKKFTKKYGVQVPYMYLFLYDYLKSINHTFLSFLYLVKHCFANN